MSVEPLKIDRKQHALSILDRFDEMRNENLNCDFTIKIGNAKFPTHGNVLAASSDYFKAMLSHDNIESRSREVELKEIDAESVKKCVDFIYTGEATVGSGDHEKLLHAAHLLQLHDLCDGIAHSLEVGLNCESFFPTKRLANIYNCKRLEAKCDEFALKNLDGISAATGFKDLEKEYILFLIKSINVKFTVCTKLNVLLQWIKLDVKNRKKYFVEMLKNLDLCKIPVSQRRYILENEPLVCDSLEFSKIFTKSVMNSLKVEIEKPEGKQILAEENAILVFDKTSVSWRSYESMIEKWTTVYEMDEEWRDRSFSAVAFNGSVYVFNETRVFQFSYSNINNKWIQMADLHEDHGLTPAVAVLGDHIYVVGHSSRGKKSKTGEKFDPIKNEWTWINDLNFACSRSALASCGGFLYNVGGRVNNQSRNEVERFDPKTNKWSFVASMNEVRIDPAVVAFNGYLYVLGGFEYHHFYMSSLSSSTVECYRPFNNTWTQVKSMQVPRNMFNACVVGGKIFAVGGLDDSRRSIESVEILNLDADKCEKAIKLIDMKIEPKSSVAVKMN